MRPTCPANSRVAIGRPLARLFLRSAENDGDFVGPRKAEAPARKGQDRHHGREQRCIDEREPEELGRIDLMPDAVHDALAEGRVDDEQDRAVIDALQRARHCAR